jgi:hypothetical protein
MRNIMMYGFIAFVAILLQTVMLPGGFKMLSQLLHAHWLQRVMLDIFLLLAIYFSFNRNFFQGLMWVLVLVYLEKACGLFWYRSHPVTYLSVFLLAQVLKIQFVFQYAPSIRTMVFCVSLLTSFIHIWVANSFYDFPSPWAVYGFSSLVSAVIQAWLAPYFFEALTRFDRRTVYRFEKQQTFFSTSFHT